MSITATELARYEESFVETVTLPLENLMMTATDSARQSNTLTEQNVKQDFKLFLRICWKSLQLPAPTRAQLAMGQYLQHGGNRVMLQCFRGLGKSWVTAAFVLWTLFCDRDKKIMVVSASKQRADDFSIFCQRCVLEFEWLSHLRPQDDDQRWSRVSFDVAGCRPAQSPSVKSVGKIGRAHV
jgi:hypothetical protein